MRGTEQVAGVHVESWDLGCRTYTKTICSFRHYTKNMRVYEKTVYELLSIYLLQTGIRTPVGSAAAEEMAHNPAERS